MVMRQRTITLAVAALLAINTSFASDTGQRIFNPAFHSLQVSPSANWMAPPVINLDSPEQIVIEFDEIAEDRRYMRYRLIHCNADWQPSGITESEYLDGFNIGDITDFDFSQATTVHYVHYRLTLPNEQTRPLLSGNYLVQIYDEQDPDTVLLQARFMLNENTSAISTALTSRTDVDYNMKHQQLSIEIDTEHSNVRDPFNDLRVIITQNNRQDNAVTLQQPLRIHGHKATYEHQKQLIFAAGNEYRRFEIINTQYPTMGVDEISYAEPYYHFRLRTDQKRADQPYAYDQTQHGRYFIREYNSSRPDIEADYVVTHFLLDMPQVTDADIYIDGDFTNRHFNAESRMTYDSSTGTYHRAMLLKQGAYNYQYLIVPKNSTTGYTAPIEGDNYQTVNEYLILIYHRPPMARYDRLIGASLIYSGQ